MLLCSCCWLYALLCVVLSMSLNEAQAQRMELENKTPACMHVLHMMINLKILDIWRGTPIGNKVFASAWLTRGKYHAR